MVSLLYADTSAIVGAYFPDEPDHRELRQLLLEGDEPVVTSQLTRVEVASAIAAGLRKNRARATEEILDRFETDCAKGGAISLIELDPQLCFPIAQKLVTQYSLRTLDAIHLATALADAAVYADGDLVVMVTRDKRQADAARANGLTVR